MTTDAWAGHCFRCEETVLHGRRGSCHNCTADHKAVESFLPLVRFDDDDIESDGCKESASTQGFRSERHVKITVSSAYVTLEPSILTPLWCRDSMASAVEQYCILQPGSKITIHRPLQR
ncbi:hypothetical protein WJX73_008732 [Symbiochloris irregularis]|uniref:Uncharacterized protein n=1 Tax=Symbiochloris irregularis TaxID=706552 RepID=A0AAW1P247_9CHLO